MLHFYNSTTFGLRVSQYIDYNGAIICKRNWHGGRAKVALPILVSLEIEL
jgi:hypothetical protein